MYKTTTHLCEISHCGKPCEFTTICHSHVKEAEDAINQFSPEELLRLYAIARGEERTAEKVARKTMGQAVSEDVLDLATFDLAQNITHHWPALIPYMAAHPDAAKLYWKIFGDCNLAQTKINGDQRKQYSEQEYEDAKKKVRYPMQAEELIEYMHDFFGIRITKTDLWNWKSRKKIDSIKVPGEKKHLYTPKQALEAYTKMC